MVDDGEPELLHRCKHTRIPTENTVAARLGRARQVRKTLKAATEPALCLEHRDFDALSGQYRGGVQACEPGADHDNVGLRGGTHRVGTPDRGPYRCRGQSRDRIPAADESSHACILGSVRHGKVYALNMGPATTPGNALTGDAAKRRLIHCTFLGPALRGGMIRGKPDLMKADWLMRRRKFLGMLGGSAVLMAGGAMPRSAGGEPGTEQALDLEDLASRVRTFVKASGRLDAGRVIWATRAEVYALLPPDLVEPVVRVKGCEQRWIRPLSDTEFLSFDSLVSYYCDFESDRVIRELQNPFTGAHNTVTPNVSRMREGREISPRGVVYRVMRKAYPDFYGDSTFDVVVRQVGESVSFQGENKWPAGFIRPPAGSKLTMFARRGELADPELSSVPADFAGYVLMPFFAWMDMADHPGHLLWHVQGYKIAALDDLDGNYLAAARADLGDRFERSPEFDSEPSRFARRLKAMGRLP